MRNRFPFHDLFRYFRDSNVFVIGLGSRGLVDTIMEPLAGDPNLAQIRELTEIGDSISSLF